MRICLNASAPHATLAFVASAIVAACGGGDTPAAETSPSAELVEGGAEVIQEPLAKGQGRVVIVGEGAAGDLVLTPHPSGPDVRPTADGRVRAGIYKVPGGTYIAVPDGGTLWVRPGASNGIMIGGLPFQLDTDIDLVGEADAGGMSHTRAQATARAVDPESMPHFGNRTSADGAVIPLDKFLERRDVIRKAVLHADLAVDSAHSFQGLAARALSTHFLVDFDGTLYQALDVGLTAYHAGELNREMVGIDLNNRLANLTREPDAGPYTTRTLPTWASATTPTTQAAPAGPCRLVPENKSVTCTLTGPAFGFDTSEYAVLPKVVVFFDGKLLAHDGDDDPWTSAPAPFVPEDIVAVGAELVAFGPDGAAARSTDGALSWQLVTPQDRLPKRSQRGRLNACTTAPAPGRACQLTTMFDTAYDVDAVAFSGQEGVTYTQGSYVEVSSDGGLSWQTAVTPALAARYGAHPRALSETMSLNGAKVQAYGYTDAQYRSLGALARTLASVFPALAEVAAVNDGKVIADALPLVAEAQGFLGHWHVEAQRWDPGPGFDWVRLGKALTTRTD